MDFMVDLETLGTDHDAVVVQIGAVGFDRHTGQITAEFSCNITPDSELDAGFKVDGDTICWWMNEASKGNCTWTSGQHRGVWAFARLADWMNKYKTKNSRVWSHSTFDAVIVTNHWKRYGIVAPVRYNQWVDLRTISLLAKGLTSIPKTKRPDGRHDALTDCRYQTEWLFECWRRLKMGT